MKRGRFPSSSEDSDDNGKNKGEGEVEKEWNKQKKKGLLQHELPYHPADPILHEDSDLFYDSETEHYFMLIDAEVVCCRMRRHESHHRRSPSPATITT
ncbi:hypothetical protein JD844_026684 [Phrynosoma platyrhinos]|uniref:Uncharacterized protein n=1 Tax=Phrynosoma platyrhinos TaxID=52577 RepID=A0ABQ7SF83_PHRPL|nr:hypothetical protein JD844_026684 [Phrynosoma platyrhinos]